MTTIKILTATVALALAVLQAPAKEPVRFATNAPALIELRDQFDVPQKLAFPSTNLIVLTIADRKGSEQVDGWIAALKARYADRIGIRGLANLAGAPGFVHGRISRKFQESIKYPIMMDWTGKVCAQLGSQPDLANILILARDGRILGRVAGAATEPLRNQAFTMLDMALAAPTNSTTTTVTLPKAGTSP